MELSSNKSQNLPKNYKTMEEFTKALDGIFANPGITVKQKTAQPEPTGHSGKNTYQIQIIPKKKIASENGQEAKIGKYEERARRLAEIIQQAELPDWLKEASANNTENDQVLTTNTTQ